MEVEPPDAEEWLDRIDPKRRRLEQILIAWAQEITHDDANEFLLRVDPEYQRNLNPNIVRKYQIDMDADAWKPGGGQPAFDAKGRLINGQHVMAAFVRSTLKTMWVVIQINRAPDAFAAYDHNRKRSTKDDFKEKGVERPGQTAGLVVPLWQYEQRFFEGKGYLSARSSSRFPTAAQLRAMLESHPGIGRHLHKNPFRGRGLAIGAMRAASYIVYNSDPELGEKFFESLIEGINLDTPRHPINVLRKSFFGLADGERLRNGETMARIFKAWNAYLRGEEIAGPLMRKGEVFPDPIAPFTAPHTPARRRSRVM